MADLSLDEFIRQKNVKVQIRNTSLKGQIQQNKGGLKTNFQKKSGQRTFDARSKLGPKSVSDARDKIIINKKSGKGDARNKIVQKQVQKGTFDARSLLKSQTKKAANGAVNIPYGPPNSFSGIQPLTRTLSNPGNVGHIGDFQITKHIPGTEVSFSRDSLQITKRGLGVGPPAPTIGDAVPIIQIRNDRYQQRQELQPQHVWSNQSSQRLPQPAHVEMSYSQPAVTRPYSSQHRYQNLNDPSNKTSTNVNNMPKMHIANIKAVEAAGMRPVSNRSAPTQYRAPPGAATLSSKQAVTLSQQLSSGALKRRQPMQEVGGPLKLGKGGGPGLQVGIGEVSPPKRARPGTGMHSSEPIEIVDVDDSSKFISPIQGFRVVVTNLFSGVTQDDIIELFGVVGPLKKARLLKAGSAEVVYSVREDAIKAVQKYHGRELDGQPMYVKMTTPSTAVVKIPPGHDPDITGEALRLYNKKPSSLGALPEAPIEVPTIHRALFKVGPPAPNKSVKFTVKI